MTSIALVRCRGFPKGPAPATLAGNVRGTPGLRAEGSIQCTVVLRPGEPFYENRRDNFRNSFDDRELTHYSQRGYWVNSQWDAAVNRSSLSDQGRKAMWFKGRDVFVSDRLRSRCGHNDRVVQTIDVVAISREIKRVMRDSLQCIRLHLAAKRLCECFLINKCFRFTGECELADGWCPYPAGR